MMPDVLEITMTLALKCSGPESSPAWSSGRNATVVKYTDAILVWICFSFLRISETSFSRSSFLGYVAGTNSGIGC
jgi:hypothetical protein